MKVKKYSAPTMPEAMNLIRKEFGSDAVILNSKVVKTKGFLGLFRKNSIEVIAAADPHPLPNKRRDKEKSFTKNVKIQGQEKIPIDQNTSTPNKELLSEVKRLTALLEIQKETVSVRSFPDPIQKIYEKLLEQEVEQAYARKIADGMLEKYFVHNKKASEDQLHTWLREEVIQLIDSYPFGLNDVFVGSKVVYFVGQTGVGKTTTIAKMAALSMMKESKKVALITMDTFRIGAIDQLKTYSQIMDIPIEVAYNYSDFVEARKKFENFDIIFVDTAGRNYKQIEFINQLMENIDFKEKDEMYLVLSATTKNSELQRIFHQFERFSIKKVILTKLDEISEFGTILNIILKCKVGIACMTNGQEVPDDLIEGSVEKIASMIVGDWKND